MPWIEVKDRILADARFNRLVGFLKCSKAQASGILIYLWLWGIHNADRDGYIEGCSAEELAEVLENCITVDSHLVADSLLKSEWVVIEDGVFRLSCWQDVSKNWYDHLEREKRAKEKCAQRKIQQTDNN